LLKGEYRQACEALLNWRFQAGRDCRLPQNWGPQGCKGVWLRQKERYDNCIAAQ
jgi:GH24 family phage-related lysozyme (muramidase)